MNLLATAVEFRKGVKFQFVADRLDAAIQQLKAIVTSYQRGHTIDPAHANQVTMTILRTIRHKKVFHK